uniref:Protein samB n=1 Tax=Erwinia piriflorinigrans CFBP 5888 TaxID=1161919 RepID=V5Z2K4_9GAMM|nr:protein samB [Erwinia piriflorinigrans CFBP 5888]
MVWTKCSDIRISYLDGRVSIFTSGLARRPPIYQSRYHDDEFPPNGVSQLNLFDEAQPWANSVQLMEVLEAPTSQGWVMRGLRDRG